MPVVKLTTEFIRNKLVCPEGKNRIEYVSDERTGLYLEVRSTSQGQGTYYHRYKNGAGKTTHKKIGRTTDTTLSQARKRVLALKAEIAQGSDPREEEKANKAKPTLTEFFEQYYIPYAKPRKRGWAKDEQLFRLRLEGEFGGLKINEISRQHIQRFHTRIKGSGLSAASANHYVKLLRHLLNLAVDWEMLDKNPAHKIPLFVEDNRVENYLNDDEMERLLSVLRADSNRVICNIALFLLSTGARMNEALQARWEHVDTSKRIWRIPASNSKSKKMRAVPLNDSAMGVIEKLKTKEEYEYLFLNIKTDKPFTNIHKVWTRLREKAGLPHLRIHDLRHQYASMLVNNGQSLYTVQQLLGHSTPIMTQRYAHLSSKSLQDAAQSVSLDIGR